MPNFCRLFMSSFRNIPANRTEICFQGRRISSNSTSKDEKSSLDQQKLWRLDTLNRFQEVPQIWIDSFDGKIERKVDLIDLHPDVFRVPPRLDILHRNIIWQQNYRSMQFTKTLSRAEMPGGGAKPWPQKKMGRHHAGSIRSSGFIRGGKAHGARGPRTWFHMLPDSIRLSGLCIALTIKHNQDDFVIVDTFDTLPQSDSQYLHDLAEERNWGYSVLFVDVPDRASVNLAIACTEIPSFNIMPMYGLNCYSMLKHDTLVLTRTALYSLQERLLEQMHRASSLNKKFRYIDMKQTLLNEGEDDEDEQGEQTPFI